MHNRTMPNEEIVNDIREWIELDTQLRELQRIAREKRMSKKILTDKIISTMKENDIDIFNTKDGKIVHTQRKQKAPITKKHLLNCLNVLFENDITARDKISNYILDSLNVKMLDSLKKKN